MNELPNGEPIWIAKTPINETVVKELWKQQNYTSYLVGITLFDVSETETPEGWLINVMPTIDLHPGEDSDDPSYSILKVIGVELSPRIKEELKLFGFTHFDQTAHKVFTSL